MNESRCECFGDSGIHASTYRPVGSDEDHCDLCGKPVAVGSHDILNLSKAPTPVTWGVFTRNDKTRPYSFSNVIGETEEEARELGEDYFSIGDWIVSPLFASPDLTA